MSATVVDPASLQARAKPLVETFQYKKKTLTEIVVDKYKEVNAHKLNQSSLSQTVR